MTCRICHKENSRLGKKEIVDNIKSVDVIWRDEHYSDWVCYLFGRPKENFNGVIYRPRKGHTPHAFARFMMRMCFDCRWVKEPLNKLR